MESPQNHIWGPNLWIILHSLAEKIGTTKNLLSEETRLWSGFLSSLRYSLPCPQCKKHYTKYYIDNKISSISDIRMWLYNLHNDVNMKTDKKNITIDEISELYNKPFHFSHHFSIILNQMVHSLKIGWNTHDDIQRTIRLSNQIKYFYDLF